MKYGIVLISVAGLLFALSAGAQSLLGEKVEFPISSGSGLSVSPTGKYLAVVSRFDCLLFVAVEGGGRWRGPFAAPGGGFFGSEANPDIDPKVRRSLPIYAWTLSAGGEEALVLNPATNRAVTFSGSSILETTPSSEIEWTLFDAPTGRLRKVALDAPKDIASRIQSAYLDIRGRPGANAGFKSRDETRAADLPLAPIVIADFSPRHDRVLCRPAEEDPLVSLNLQTGERVAFPIHQRDRALPGDMGGSYSPDGLYVLMQYSYGPDDHYAGGYLQLFTRDGRFVEEVAEFDKDVGQPVGFHEWLSDNWIVYSTGKELVFRKFLGP